MTKRAGTRKLEDLAGKLFTDGADKAIALAQVQPGVVLHASDLFIV
jgi:hypothetical protein